MTDDDVCDEWEESLGYWEYLYGLCATCGHTQEKHGHV